MLNYIHIAKSDRHFLQDAYHELHQEMPEVRDKLIEDCIQWVEKHSNEDRYKVTAEARL